MNYYLLGATAMHQSPKSLCLFLLFLLTSFSLEYQESVNIEPKPITLQLINKADQLTHIASMVGGLTKAQQDWLQQHPSTLSALDRIATDHDQSDLEQAHQIFDHFTQDADPLLNSLLLAQETAYLKALHPDWQLTKIIFKASWNVFSGQLHTALDLVGLIPGWGEGADFVNGVFYTLEGDGANATYSFAAMVPFVGWLSTGAKYAGKIVKTAAKGTTELKFIVNSQGVIKFGNRRQLTRVIGGKKKHQAHHLIPWALNDHKIVQKAADSGDWHPNLAKNGQHLDLSVHNGFITKREHDAYNASVRLALDKLRDENRNISPQEATEMLEFLANKARTQLKHGKKLDQIIL